MKILVRKEVMFARWLGGGPVPPLHLLRLALISVAGGVC